MIQGRVIALAMLCIALLSGCPNNEGGIIGNGLTGGSVKERPVARDPGNIRGFEDTPIDFTLTGTFTTVKGGGELYVIITHLPVHGSIIPIEGFAPLDVTYTPDPEFSSFDEIDFLVVDANANVSKDVTVDITIEAVNDAPVAISPGLTTTAFDTPVVITLNATDVDSASLYAEVVGGASHGTLNWYAGFIPLNTIYTPGPGYYGADEISFIVHDFNEATSAPATALIGVTAPAFPLTLAFLSPPQTVQAGACSAVNEIETRDDTGRAIKMPAHLTVEFDGPPSATFYADPDCAVPLSFLIVARGASDATFYFLDTDPGTPEYTVSDAAAVILPASQSHVITSPPMSLAKDLDPNLPVVTVHKSTRHECIIYGGALYCRGANEYGQLGDGTSEYRNEAVQVGEDRDWTRTDLGRESTCGDHGGGRYCWGLGYGPTPIPVP